MSRFQRKRVFGMALVSVLMVSIVLLAMAAAFFTSHKADLSLMVSTQAREQAKNGCLSAAEFIQYKLENDRFFGRAPFGSNPAYPIKEKFPEDSDEPILTVTYEGDRVDPLNNVVRGYFPATETHFEAWILNNLDNDIPAGCSKGQAPPRSVRVWIATKKDNVTKNLDFILKRSPFASATLLSGRDIDVSLSSSATGAWWLGSRQPSGNAVRAKGTIRGPEVYSTQNLAILFEPSEGVDDRQSAPYGVLQGTSISLQVNGVSTEIDSDDHRLSLIQSNIQGSVSPGSGDFNVPTLDSEELRKSTHRFRVPNQEVSFRTVYVNGDPVHQLLGDGQVIHEYNPNVTSYSTTTSTTTIESTSGTSAPPPPATSPGKSAFGHSKGKGKSSNPFDEWPGQTGGGETTTTTTITTHEVVSIDRFHAWSDGSYPVALFDLETRTMAINQDVELHSDHNFTLNAKTENNSPDRDGQPTLILGNEFRGSTLAAQGINIDGSVGGQGALKALDDGLKIRAKSSLSTTPDFGIALHSTGDVELSRPERSNRDGLPIDWEAFKIAVESGSSESRALSEQLDNWMDQENQQIVADRLQRVKLAEAGNDDDFEAIWLGLTREFPADELAQEKLKEWMFPGQKASPGKGPSDDGPGPGKGPGKGGPNQDVETEHGGGDSAAPPSESSGTEAIPSGGGVTLDRYIRLREYLRTAKRGEPDASWLDPISTEQAEMRSTDVTKLITSQLSAYQVHAGQSAFEVDGVSALRWNSLRRFFAGSNPFLSEYHPDMTFRGLIYAGGDFKFDTKSLGVEIEGALVAHGDVKINNATGARFIYNGELLENLFATYDGDNSVKLERSFWTFY